MKHPPYHLRVNKAVDRLLFIETIRRVERIERLAEYTYYGFGGPYLDDFRLIYERFPEVGMVSIEEDNETLKRQRFHAPCGNLRLERSRFKSFLTRYQAEDEKSIFWLDYPGLEYGDFEDFMVLLGKVSENSMVKITLRAQPSDFFDQDDQSPWSGPERFRKQFGAVMPDPEADPPLQYRDFVRLLQEMVHVAAQKALPGAVPLTFQPICSFYYNDGTGMFTLTGIVCRRGEEGLVKGAFQDLQFRNLNWGAPKVISVPILSTQERLHLQKLLPCNSSAGRLLREALGYLIEDDRPDTERKLKQYADFHRYYPFFMRAVP